MLHIALCDSNKVHLFEIERCLVAILFDKCEFEIKKFVDTEQLVPDILNQKNSYDLIVMEQHTAPFSGIQIAKIVDEYRINTEVILVTDDILYALEGYKYRLFDYMIKPVSFYQLKNTINRYIGYNTAYYEHFSYKVRNKILKVKMTDITYFESAGRKITIFTINGKEEFYGKMDEIEKQIRVTYFSRTHQSYLVNVHYIKNVLHDEIILDNGKEIPVSRSRHNSVKEKFINYLSEGI